MKVSNKVIYSIIESGKVNIKMILYISSEGGIIFLSYVYEVENVISKTLTKLSIK